MLDLRHYYCPLCDVPETTVDSPFIHAVEFFRRVVSSEKSAWKRLMRRFVHNSEKFLSNSQVTNSTVIEDLIKNA